jgi:hypothetical protein
MVNEVWDDACYGIPPHGQRADFTPQPPRGRETPLAISESTREIAGIAFQECWREASSAYGKQLLPSAYIAHEGENGWQTATRSEGRRKIALAWRACPGMD